MLIFKRIIKPENEIIQTVDRFYLHKYHYVNIIFILFIYYSIKTRALKKCE